MRAGTARPRGSVVVWILGIVTAIACVGLTVNPWSRDGWFQTQYYLIGHFPGHDDFTPIAAPALLFKSAHGIASLLGLGIVGEMYVASILQNVLLFASAYLLYRALKLLRLTRTAGPAAIIFLLFALSTGVGQQFYSECTTLFLMSGVVLALAAVLRTDNESPRRFWMLAAVCAIAVALLVATRLTPVFLIPGAALLLFGRIPARRAAQFTGTLTLVTAAMLGGMLLANHARFNRYEITNSTGRHLWQGVKDFSDRALAHSELYRALKRHMPHVQGKYWDTLPPRTFDPNRADPREAMLRELAREAIRNAPALYLLHGAEKFVMTIGRAPSRDAFNELVGNWNPTHRTTNLPSLLDALHASHGFSEAVFVSYWAIWMIFAWVYPLSIFAIGITCLAVILYPLRPTRSMYAGAGARFGRIAAAIFYVVGVALVCLPIMRFGRTIEGMAGSVACALMLGACGAMLSGPAAEGAEREGPALGDRPVMGMPLRFLLVSALIFFGTLWFTWQVEVGMSRYALPYLPFWTIMLAVSFRYWHELDARNARARRAIAARGRSDPQAVSAV